MLAPEARLPVRASLDMYSKILRRIEENEYDNFRKVRLARVNAAIVARTRQCGHAFGAPAATPPRLCERTKLGSDAPERSSRMRRIVFASLRLQWREHPWRLCGSSSLWRLRVVRASPRATTQLNSLKRLPHLYCGGARCGRSVRTCPRRRSSWTCLCRGGKRCRRTSSNDDSPMTTAPDIDLPRSEGAKGLLAVAD